MLRPPARGRCGFESRSSSRAASPSSVPWPAAQTATRRRVPAGTPFLSEAKASATVPPARRGQPCATCPGRRMQSRPDFQSGSCGFKSRPGYSVPRRQRRDRSEQDRGLPPDPITRLTRGDSASRVSGEAANLRLVTGGTAQERTGQRHATATSTEGQGPDDRRTRVRRRAPPSRGRGVRAHVCRRSTGGPKRRSSSPHPSPLRSRTGMEHRVAPGGYCWAG